MVIFLYRSIYFSLGITLLGSSFKQPYIQNHVTKIRLITRFQGNIILQILKEKVKI